MTTNLETNVPQNEVVTEGELVARLYGVAQDAYQELGASSEEDAREAEALLCEMDTPLRTLPREALEDRGTRYNALRELARELTSGDELNTGSARDLIRRMAVGASPRWLAELAKVRTAWQYPHVLLCHWTALHLDHDDSPIRELWPAGNQYDTRESIDSIDRY